MSEKAKEIEAARSQLLELVSLLTKKEHALRIKIDAEHNEQTQIALRRDFYKVRLSMSDEPS